jgi:AraC-like DNA-binding protein
MVWMLDAPAKIVHAGGEFVLDVGDVMVMPDLLEVEMIYSPGVSHQGYVVFDCEPLPERVEHRSLAVADIIPAVLNHILRLEAERPEGWRDLATRAFGYAWAAWVSGNSSTERHTSFSSNDAVSRVIGHVRRVWGDLTYTRPLSLDELAQAARVSRPYLCRVFERDIGVGPVECFRLMQLKRAANYLDQTSLSVAEISARAGYSEESAFSRAFKNATGYSPRAFRSDRALEFDLPTGVRRLVYSTLLT